MITREELTQNKPVDPKHEANILKLLQAVNEFRKAYGKPMFVTSGYRTMADHLRIYREKGITDTSKIPMKSNHLFGLAVDFADPSNHLKLFVKQNLPLMEKLGLYFEHFDATVGWLHVQIVPPRSGSRFFRP